jgi:AcrR family transcriptional regulator
LLETIRRQSENKGVSPRDRLSNFFRASFAREILDPQLFNVWLVFWSMVAHSAEIRAVHFSTYAKYRSVLESLLNQLVVSGAAPPIRLRPAAIALSALLDGLWVELSLSSAVFKPREAIALCEDWVNALCNGGFPWLLAAPRAKKNADTARKRRNA